MRVALLAALLVAAAFSARAAETELVWTLAQREITGRQGHAMAYDAARERIVLVGGRAGSDTFGDTWTWGGSAWSKAASPVSPARYGHALAYDAAASRVVLFGGCCGSAFDALADTWTWDGSIWRKEVPITSPRARHLGAMAYDAARARVVLFGGLDGRGELGDTWSWDGTVAAWTKMAPETSPSPRHGHAMAYDAARGEVVLFGGRDGSGVLADTWTWDGTAWTKRLPALSPPATFGASLAYDAGTAAVRLLATGGLWTWDGSSWTRTEDFPGPVRTEAALAYDPGRGALVVFGGRGGSDVALRDTWVRSNGVWTGAVPAGPRARMDAAIAYDEARGRIVLFGGRTPEGFAKGGDETANPLGDLWEWDGSRWIERVATAYSSTQPAPRYGARMAYDRLSGTVVLYGGAGLEDHCIVPGGSCKVTVDYFNDMWRWNGTAWSKVSVPTPSRRAYHGMAFDRSRNKLVVFGGVSMTGLPKSVGLYYYDDTYEWDGVSWKKNATAGPPNPLARAAFGFTYDPVRSGLLLFGGGLATNAPMESAGENVFASEEADPGERPGLAFGDTWQLKGGKWSASGAALPPPRTHAGMEAGWGGVFAYGGLAGETILGDVWEWDGALWNRRTPDGDAGPRQGHAMAFDEVGNAFVVFGGCSETCPAETWVLSRTSA